jgi:hypothetical protein
MKKTLFSAAMVAAVTLLGSSAFGGTLTGNVTISELFPNMATVFNGGTDTLAVGGSLSCPGASALCTSGYFNLPGTFTITPTTISLSEQCCVTYAGGAFNGYSFTNLTFLDGGSLGSVTLSSSNMGGIVPGDVTFTANSIFINLQGVAEGANSSPGVYTLTVTEAGVPEPGTFGLIGAALVGVTFLIRRRR